jgi:hypothetical protein
MQCILYKIYFWNVFHMYNNLICIFICTPICTKSYSCKKWMLQSHSCIWCELAREGWNGRRASPHPPYYWLGKTLRRGSDDSSDGWMTFQPCKWKCKHPSIHKPAWCMTSSVTLGLTLMLKSCKDLSLGEMPGAQVWVLTCPFHSQLFQLSCHFSHWLYHCHCLDC